VPQLKRERSLRARFAEANGNYHNISNTWLVRGFPSSSPLTPASQSSLCGSCAGRLAAHTLKYQRFCIVSCYRLRGQNSADSRKSVRAFKGIICADVFEFESSHPSQAVPSLWGIPSLQKYMRHPRGLALPRAGLQNIGSQRQGQLPDPPEDQSQERDRHPLTYDYNRQGTIIVVHAHSPIGRTRCGRWANITKEFWGVAAERRPLEDVARPLTFIKMTPWDVLRYHVNSLSRHEVSARSKQDDHLQCNPSHTLYRTARL
jgi:hypothetical protein